VSQHLTSQQISEYLAGQRIPATEEHLRGCPDCAAEVERATEPLKLFRASVCALGERQMGPTRFVAQGRPARAFGPLQWQLAMVAAALVIAAIPLVRHFQPAPRTTAPIAMAQVAGAQVSDEALLRQVETEISRSVPATMEPLEKLMSGDDNRRAE
jgi:hypothetical protein